MLLRAIGRRMHAMDVSRGVARRAAAGAAVPARPPQQQRTVRVAACAQPTTQQQQRGAPLGFALMRPERRLQFRWGGGGGARRSGDASGASPHSSSSSPPALPPRVRLADMAVEVDVLLEGAPAGLPPKRLRALEAAAEADAAAAVRAALARRASREPRYRLPAVANVSLVLCDDAYIAALNARTRGVDGATDVLSFELPDDGMTARLPVRLLGDLVVSLDTAGRQAKERRHSLEDELRVLLVHGALHLTGLDHERSAEAHALMAGEERSVMAELGWRGAGLIDAVDGDGDDDDDDGDDAGGRARVAGGGGAWTSSSSSASCSASATTTTAKTTASPSPALRRRSTSTPRVPLLALDMDGTLLDSSSRVPPSAAAAVRAAIAAGTRVVCATGKARPAAIAAAAAAGLAGDALLVSRATPGVFLQGLAVHGAAGAALSSGALPRAAVADAFAWAERARVTAVAFLGDECATLRMTREVQELHDRYYEPLATVLPSLDALLAGAPVRKILFMAAPEDVEARIKPHWVAQTGGGGVSNAALLQAVPDMLELVPAGVDKWVGLRVLLDHLGVPADQIVAVGDGGNDLEMVRGAGVGVAMGNAVPAVRAAADHVVAANDNGGIAEAIERFVL